MDINIRQAAPDELETVLIWRMETLREVFAPVDHLIDDAEWAAIEENTRAYYRQTMQSGEHIAYLAQIDGVIVGCGGVCVHRELPSPDNLGGGCAYLMNIYTKARYRGHGVATALIRHMIEQAQAQGISKIYLETSFDAERLYRSMGFRDMDGYMMLGESRWRPEDIRR